MCRSSFKNKKFLIAFVAIVLINYPYLSHATEGEHAVEFLSTGVGARALGMGSAFVSVADDATAAYWNPAGLASIPASAFSAMYSDVFESSDGGFLTSGLVKYSFANYIHRLNLGVVGISWIRVGIDDIPRTTFIDTNGNGILGDFRDKNDNDVKDPGETYIDRPTIAEYFNNTDDALLLSYAKKLNGKILVGGNFKLIRQTIYQNQATGWGMDLGLLTEPVDKLRIGFLVQDTVGTRVKWDTPTRASFIRKPSLILGASYILTLPVVNTTFSIDIDNKQGNLEPDDENEHSVNLHYGLETCIFNILALRVGYEKDKLAAGAGFRLQISQLRVSADYAFTSHELGDSQRISISGKF